MIKVALAEDNNLLAQSIEEKLKLFSEEIEFCFRAINGQDILEHLSENQSIDVILMDIEMPVMNGIQATQQINSLYPEIKVIILTVFDDETNIFNAIKAGANGYFLKESTPSELIDGIRMIMAGGAPMSPTIAAKSLELLRNPLRHVPADTQEAHSLSKREAEVLVELSDGLDYNQIADKLFIAPSTVRKHIENIYKKLQVNNKISAVQKAQRNNLI
ncbi:MAG: response regulator transcription factor [Bacteroidetes bacterium]|nr:response regulator transcription factor [Bacteroidota bacterium]